MKRLATTSTVVAREPHNSNAVKAAGEWRPAMDHVGIDVHKRESQVCILTPTGEVMEVRIATTRERLRAVLGERPRAKVLIESSTESEWVARCLEELGHEVVRVGRSTRVLRPIMNLLTTERRYQPWFRGTLSRGVRLCKGQHLATEAR
jgi:hypothetical protein